LLTNTQHKTQHDTKKYTDYIDCDIPVSAIITAIFFGQKHRPNAKWRTTVCSLKSF